jgi:NADH:ubiquinone oxidoreductase subunit 6 (subunit J)
MMESVIFYLVAFLIVASALAVVTLRNIFHCALFLIMCLFSVAGIYVLLSAEFVAVVQVLLYVGAVAVLMLFAIMLTSKLAGREIQMSNEQTFIGAFMALVMIGGLVWSFTKTYFHVAAGTPPPQSTLQIGNLLMNEYVLPFELISVLLLAALIGAIVLARQEGN